MNGFACSRGDRKSVNTIQAERFAGRCERERGKPTTGVPTKTKQGLVKALSFFFTLE